MQIRHSTDKEIIRKAATEDALAIRQIVLEQSDLLLTSPSQGLPPWFIRSIDETTEEISAPKQGTYHYVYQFTDTVVGYLSIIRDNHIRHFFVKRAFHRQGIAQKLWQHFLQQNPLQPITVNSSLYAKPVYQRLGFVVTGNIEFKDGLGFQPMLFEQHVPSSKKTPPNS